MDVNLGAWLFLADGTVLIEMVFLKGKSGRRERAQFTSVESTWSWRPLSVAATCCYAGTPAPCRARAVTFGPIFINIDVKEYYTRPWSVDQSSPCVGSDWWLLGQVPKPRNLSHMDMVDIFMSRTFQFDLVCITLLLSSMEIQRWNMAMKRSVLRNGLTQHSEADLRLYWGSPHTFRFQPCM